ncbi:hypothetical protein FIU97_18155 [Roseivivax sp. THAF40]|uniref:hypothetical protein n=1 Tax=unclassified Roseivivax TaxID=2639302 RepID=UPI001269845D|nr:MULTISPECIES: hypothetical protein [unclassified Roseivivax]QFS84687.1 hypothetical protein FIV09_17745 [Roseivivax sp. THAF197b]QFT48514.1 hypothetical protein FIU97_18155 [Roseivivax sp. THAF40]
MKAWDIFSHSVRLVWRNRWDALRISGALYAAYAVVQVIFLGSGTSPNGVEGDVTQMAPEELSTLFFAVLLQSVVTLWIAVAWHRFVLLEEYPAGWLPQFHGGAIFNYFWRSVAIVLAITLAIMVPVTLLVAIAPILSVFAGFAALFLAIVMGFRLAPALPAAAMGQPVGFRDVWSATEGQTGTAIALAFIGVFAAFVIQLPVFVVSAISPDLGNVLFIVLNWFVTLVSASILTTLFGHYVQGRPIE